VGPRPRTAPVLRALFSKVDTLAVPMTPFLPAPRASEADLSSLMTEAYAVRILDAPRLGKATAVRNHDGTHVLAGAADYKWAM
jgi:hypothetical protein